MEVVRVSQRNMSDIIEAYLKSFLQNTHYLEIRRSDIADHFDCVPSQINYVINTRFTQEHGYFVESKRGGGGYIRILKVELANDAAEVDSMLDLIGDKLSYRNGVAIIETLVDKEIITAREGRLILSVIEKSVLHSLSNQDPMARALLLSTFLQELKYELKAENH